MFLSKNEPEPYCSFYASSNKEADQIEEFNINTREQIKEVKFKNFITSNLFTTTRTPQDIISVLEQKNRPIRTILSLFV